jgi:hypothetical protein
MSIKIEDVLKFQIEEANTDPLKMREFIRKLGLQEIKLSLNFCQQNVGRDPPKRNYGLIYQDLINVLGEKLGFDVNFGDYKVGPDGFWQHKDITLIVESKSSSTWLEIKQASDYVSEKKAKSGLIVCPSFTEDNVKAASGYGNVRLITSEALCNLTELKEKGIVSTDDVVNILIPQESVKLDYLVNILYNIIVKPVPTKEQIAEEPFKKKALVGIYPSKPEGVEFLQKNKAWGYVKKPAKKLDYAAFHITHPVHAILYYGKIRRIVPQEEHPTLADKTKKGKYIIDLEYVKKLENPISGPAPRGMIYTTISKLFQAKTTEDL